MTSPSLPSLDGVLRHVTRRVDWERIVRRIRMPERLKLLALLVGVGADQHGRQFWPDAGELAAYAGYSEEDVCQMLLVLCDEYGLLRHVTYGLGICCQLTIPSDYTTRFDLVDAAADGTDTRSVE